MKPKKNFGKLYSTCHYDNDFAKYPSVLLLYVVHKFQNYAISPNLLTFLSYLCILMLQPIIRVDSSCVQTRRKPLTSI